ncbi:MAG: hypothetical protein HQK56_06210 [Deltaproteobacteria bacterium]|nr:hypothetical protein [Deltaproteobacteria bacterium]
MAEKNDAVDFLLKCKEEALTARQDIEAVWKECYKQYRSEEDFGNKQEWQHRTCSPEVFPAVKGAVATIKNLMIRSEDYFTIEKVGGEDAGLADGFTKLVQFHLRDCDFTSRFCEAVESAFVLSLGVLKLFVGEEPRTSISGQERITRRTARLKCEVVDPFQLFFPMDKSFFIEEKRVTVPYLHTMAQRGLFDKGVVEQVAQEDYGSDERESERLTRLGLTKVTNPYRREVVLHEYWGDLIGLDNRAVQRNVTFVVANEKYLIRPPVPNPFWHGKPPYVMITPLQVLFRHVGTGLVEGVRTLQRALNNLVNIQLDSILFRMLNLFEVNQSNLIYPEDLEELYPGKIFRKGTDAPLVTQIPMSEPSMGAFRMMEQLRRSIQNYTGVTDFLMGLGVTSGGTTATEVSSKVQQSNAMFESIARDIERQGIVGAVDLAKDLIIQFLMDADPGVEPNAARILGQAGVPMDAMSLGERMDLLEGDWDVYPRGISVFLEKSEALSQLISFLDILGKNPAFSAQVNSEALLRRILEAFRFPDISSLLEPELPPEVATGLMNDPDLLEAVQRELARETPVP